MTQSGYFLFRRKKVWPTLTSARRICELRKAQVTPFLAKLFPTQCNRSDEPGIFEEDVSAVRHALSFGNEKQMDVRRLAVPPPTSPLSSPSFSPHLRSWHLIANLKSAEIHSTNGENKDKHPEATRDVLYSSIRDDRDSIHKASPRIKRPVTSTEIIRLLRRSVGGMRRYEQTANAATNKSSQEVEKNEINFDMLLSRALCASDTIEEGDTEGLKRSLRIALDHTRQTSAYTFHLSFEALMRQGENQLAIELFRRWWQHNPHLFPIEMEVYDEAEASLRALRAIRPGHTAANEQLTVFRRDVLAPRLTQMPHKKYFISSALFTRIIFVAVRFGDTALVDQFVIKEILHEGVLETLCGGVMLFSSSYSSSSSSVVEIDEAKLRFDPIREKFEDWLVLAGAIAAAALLERHAMALRRGPAAFDREKRLVREEYMSFMRRACRLDDTMSVPAWTQLLFTTILRCHEESGVFHMSPARRPGNVAELWQCMHSRLLRQFPNVFHAGNAVTTLLSFAALEETAVSSLGTQHLSFVGKEEALCRWRLECIGTKNIGSGNSFTKLPREWRNRPPKSSRRLRARFVAAHCSDSGDIPVASLEEKENEEHEMEVRPRGQHRKGFGAVQNFAVSQMSLPVFLTPQDVMDSASDALDVLSVAHHFALDIFRAHTAQMVLCPGKDTTGRQSRGDIAAEASKPSLFLLVRLLSLLAVAGERVKESDETGSSGSGGDFALVECITEDLLPFCHPSVAVSLQKICVSHLSRSGAAGVRALVTEYRKFLDLMTESDALERLLFGLLWSGGSDGDTMGPGYSFGSGSEAWQVMARNRQALKSCGTMLEMALSHLATLAIAIPDDHRRLMSIRQCVCRVVNLREAETGEALIGSEEAEVAVLREELQWNPPASVHVYVSLLELLSWALDGESGEGCVRTRMNTDVQAGADSDVDAKAKANKCEDGNDDDDDDDDVVHMGNVVPSLAVTMHQWHTVWLRLYEMSTYAPTLGQPMSVLSPALLERVCVILLHSCPDVDILITCLLILLRPRHETMSLELHGLPAVPSPQTAPSFVTPRLLSSLSSLLISNGVQAVDIETWRRENGAPSPLFDGTSSLYQWHRECLERCVKGSSHENSSHRGSVESVLLLGSMTLDMLLSDPRWQALRRDNYYAAALAPVTEGSAFPFGVVLPSRQMASSYPAGVRQRITNLRDALREMPPDERWRLRRSLSSVCDTKSNDIISLYSISDDDDDDGDVVVTGENVCAHSGEVPS